MTSFELSSSPSSVSELDIVFRSRRVQQKQLSLRDFLRALPRAIDEEKHKNETSPSGEGGPIAQLMRELKLTAREIDMHAHFDECKHYTRNLIATDDECKSYTLMLLCWNPGRASPIHDHPCDGCWMRVLSGTVQERRYIEKNGQLQCTAESVFREGQLAYISDSLGYHKVTNPSPTVKAITLHLYCPPFQTCRIWMDDDRAASTKNKAPSLSRTCFHSEYGVVLVKKNKKKKCHEEETNKHQDDKE